MSSECDDDRRKNSKSSLSSVDVLKKKFSRGDNGASKSKPSPDMTQRKSTMHTDENKVSREENGAESSSDKQGQNPTVQIGHKKVSREENGIKSESSTHAFQQKSSVQTSEKKVRLEVNGSESNLEQDKPQQKPKMQIGRRKISRAESSDVMVEKETDRRSSNETRKGSIENSIEDKSNGAEQRSKSVISVTFNNIKDHVMSTKPKKRRLLGKKGGLKVKALHVQQKGGLYFSDLFTTLVDCDWKWIIVIFASCFVGSWILFGLLWLAVARSRNLYHCIDNVDNFASALLFSIETQTTIGFGGRAVTPSCPDAIIILIAQSLIGLLMSAFLLGLVFTKLARPSRRADTLLFSKNALIAPRDGRMCLLFRVGDIRESRILDAQIRVQLFRTRHTAEGQDIPFYQQDLKCGIDWSDKGSGNSRLFLVMPLTIIHVIDEDSPFYEMGPEDFNSKADFEVVAVLEGVVESTSMLVEARTSYLGDEIFWGRDFTQVLHENCWDENQGKYLVDFALFHGSVPVELPLVSAKEFYSRSQDDEVKSIIRKARAKSRRILSSRTPRQEGLVKQYTEIWKRKFATIHEVDTHKINETSAASKSTEEQ